MQHKKYIIWAIITISGIVILSEFNILAARGKRTKKHKSKKYPHKRKKDAIEIIETQPYKSKEFDLTTKVSGLSKGQINQHKKLYHGYVKKRNEIQHDLQTVDRSNIANITYSEFRSLKVSETFAHNGMLLHELYFGNLGTGKKIGPQAQQLLIKSFGSLEAFKKDLIDSASCSRGWVVTVYSIDDGKMHNFILDAHNETVPVLVLPILVIDIYEHAYMIDFGIDRKSYLETMWDNIDWDVVEYRIAKWVNKFHVAPKK